MILLFIFFSLPILNYFGLAWSDQDSNFTITINPGATNSDSQNPIAPANATVPEGSTIIWLNNDSTPHLIVSGTPDQGPSNIFYGDYFSVGESYNITLDNAGDYNYYDPAWSHIRGQITVVPNNNDTVVEDTGSFFITDNSTNSNSTNSNSTNSNSTNSNSTNSNSTNSNSTNSNDSNNSQMGLTLATNLFSALLPSNDIPSNSASVNQSHPGILDKVRQIFNNLVGDNTAIVDNNETSFNSMEDDKWSSFFSNDLSNVTDNSSSLSSLFSTNVTSAGFEFMPSYTPPYYPRLSWGVNGTGDGQIFAPLGITIDKNDDIYVSDYVLDRIQKFEYSKNYTTENVSTWGSTGTSDGQFLGPRSLATDSSNNVYVSDPVNSLVQKFDSNGTFLTKWGSSGKGDGMFVYPSGVAIDDSDNVYVVDDGN